MSVEDKLKQVEEAIRQGNTRSGLVALRSLSLSKIPRSNYAWFANLSWRCGDAKLALRVLAPLVLPKPGTLVSANDKEKLEYACALMRLGGYIESEALLNTLNAEQNPKVYLYRAYVAISQWNYLSAVEPLKIFLKKTPADSYEWIVASINLAACFLVLLQADQAGPILNHSREVCQAKGFKKILVNTHELLCQLALQKNNWSVCEDEIRTGLSLATDRDSVDVLFFQKWQAVSQALKNPSTENINAIENVRRQAERKSHWETVRDCDLYLSSLKNDENLFANLYYGTPYPVYRNRICTLTNRRPPEKPSAWIDVGPKNSAITKHKLDLELGHFDQENLFERQGQVLHQLLISLSQDFYRPMRLAQLFQSLFPAEHFLVEHSPNRIHQLVHRLRQVLKQKSEGITIVQKGSLYKLNYLKPFSLRISQNNNITPLEATITRAFLVTQPLDGITTNDLQTFLGCSLRTAQRLILQAEEKSLIHRIDGSNRPIYQLAKFKQSA